MDVSRRDLLAAAREWLPAVSNAHAAAPGMSEEAEFPGSNVGALPQQRTLAPNRRRCHTCHPAIPRLTSLPQRGNYGRLNQS